MSKTAMEIGLAKGYRPATSQLSAFQDGFATASAREARLVEALERIDLRVNSQFDHGNCCKLCANLLNRIGDDTAAALAEYRGEK